MFIIYPYINTKGTTQEILYLPSCPLWLTGSLSLVLASASADGHDNTDKNCGGDDHAKQVLQNDGTGICSGDDIGDKTVNNHEGYDADYNGN